MTSRVEIVQLGPRLEESGYTLFKYPITRDFDTLAKYKGDGKCSEVQFNCLYKEAQKLGVKMNWDIERIPGELFPGVLLSRKKQVK